VKGENSERIAEIRIRKKGSYLINLLKEGMRGEYNSPLIQKRGYGGSAESTRRSPMVRGAKEGNPGDAPIGTLCRHTKVDPKLLLRRLNYVKNAQGKKKELHRNPHQKRGETGGEITVVPLHKPKKH